MPLHLARTGDGWRRVDGDRALAIRVDTCPVCGGAWFDRGELDTLAQDGRGGDDPIEAALERDGTACTRSCPRGHGPMRSHALADRRLRSPIERCPTCHGLWLDGTERRKLARATTRATHGHPTAVWGRRGAIWLAQLLTHVPVESHNPTRGRTLAVFALLGAMLAGFALQLAGHAPASRYGLVAPAVLAGAAPASLLTYALLHGGWGHLLSNAYFLYVFGDNVEHVLGTTRVLLLAALAAVAGALAHVLLEPGSTVPVVGASGLVSGVLAAYLWTFPRNKLLYLLLFVQIEIPAWIYLVLWFALQVFMLTRPDGGAVAWSVHAGGFALGLALTPLLHRARRRELAAKSAHASAEP